MTFLKFVTTCHNININEKLITETKETINVSNQPPIKTDPAQKVFNKRRQFL